MEGVLMLIALAVGTAAGYLWRRQVTERTIASAQKRAGDIIREAETSVQNKKRELELESKETIFQLRNEVERETKNKRRELQFQEKRLQQREFNLERKSEVLDKREEEVVQREKAFAGRENELKEKEGHYLGLIEEEKKRLEQVSGMSRDEAKNHLVQLMAEEARKDAARIQKRIEDEAREVGEKTAREIVLTAMQRLAGDQASESSVSVVSLPSDEVKGRIIGREGRNIKTFEAQTGVDLIVDDTPEAVTISSFSLYRREIARLALERLISDGRIHPGRIEEVVDKVKRELDEKVVEEGTGAAFEVGVENVHPELIKLLGRLKFRTSFGQNVLQHTKESAFLAGMIAADLGLDQKLARRCALFHDIGKAIDQEVEGSHPDVGAEQLKKYGERPEVIAAAGMHHHDTDIQQPYTVITAIADAISATRPGARRDTVERYLRRVEELEQAASTFKGVDQAYAISAGREIRVIVKPQAITDDEAKNLARDLAKKIEDTLQYVGQVRVTVIREIRETSLAK